MAETRGLYKINYTTRDEPRDKATRPRSGSFVEFTETDCSSTHIFHSLHNPKKMSGFYNTVREFKRFDEGEKSSILPTGMGAFRAIAVKKMKTEEEYDIKAAAEANKKVRGFGECISHKKQQYQFYEFIDGTVLSEYKFKNDVDVLECITALAQDLEHLHNSGYVHSDFCENNIIVGECEVKDSARKKTVKVIDLDFAEKMSESSEAYDDIYEFGSLLLKISSFRCLPQTTKAFIRQICTPLTEPNSFQKNLPLSVIKDSLTDYLTFLQKDIQDKSVRDFEYSRQVLKLFLLQQINSLNYECEKKSEGSRNKKEQFEKIVKELQSDHLTEEKLNSLIMQAAIISNYRRKINQDRLGYVSSGLLTLGLGFFLFNWNALSWRQWENIRFPAGSSYANTYAASLKDETRKVTVDGIVKTSYENFKST